MCEFCDPFTKRTPKHLITDEKGNPILSIMYGKPEGQNHYGWYLIVNTGFSKNSIQIHGCPICKRDLCR